MLVVGIILKNVPYNFGQFGRAECTPDGHNASFADSIHDFDSISEHSSFKRSISDTILAAVKIQPVPQGAGVRRARSVPAEAAPEEDTGEVTDCHPKYIGHELDPLIARQVTSTVQYSTVQYSTVQYSTVQYSTVQYTSWTP